MEPRQDVPVLRPNDLFIERASRDKARLRAYNQLLEQIYNRIKTTARIPGNTWIVYTVPPFVFGLPKIDLEDCVVYLVFQLRQAKYEVRYTYPNLLFISWKHHERNYILEESPIMKAMLPPETKPASVSAKGAGGKRGLGGGTAVRFIEQQQEQQQQQQRQLSIAGPPSAPTRSAGEYAPPNSFLNAMSGGLGENPSRKEKVLNDLFQF